jgi:membrane protease YdiL (CAAX protease family)
MTPTLLDHLLVAFMAVILPVEGYFEVRHLIAALARNDPSARSRALIRTIALQWTLVAALLAGWQTAARPWSALGLAASDTRGTIIGAAVTAVALGLMLLQYRSVRALTPERRQRLIARTGDAIRLLPATPTEHRVFNATAITAGICEELLCRGFMFWYLAHWFNPWTTVLVASIPFGLAHIYQGPKGAIRTGVIALLVGALYILTGSLIWPMLVHAIVDLGGGALGRFLASPSASPPPQAPTHALA